MIPGELFVAETGPITLNEGRESITLEVTNKGDRPVQVGSHFHFAEAGGQQHLGVFRGEQTGRQQQGAGGENELLEHDGQFSLLAVSPRKASRALLKRSG